MIRNILILIILLATVLTVGSVDSIYTDDKKYDINEVVVITVVADDGDTVSVQVSHKNGNKYTVVWNSTA